MPLLRSSRRFCNLFPLLIAPARCSRLACSSAFGHRIGRTRHQSSFVELAKRRALSLRLMPATGRQKFASAHDLRRSFGDRWSRRVLPQHLQELMRHESISTTLRYYAERTWDVLTAARKRQARLCVVNDPAGHRNVSSAIARSSACLLPIISLGCHLRNRNRR